jgi:nucleoprotein TPR
MLMPGVAERYKMLKGNFDMLRSENGELQKRIVSLHETQAKQDLTTQKFLADLVDSQSLLEGMRNENANLKAEKSLWKNIEQRLAQENESLTQERVRLNGLVANLQAIQGERERNESETRRRLNSQNEKLETEIQQVKRRLSEEMEEAKKLAARKEIDSREAQKKIDGLNSTLSSTRESLVAAQTSQTHMQSRVDELAIQLKSAEEKLAIYQSKPQHPPSAPAVTEEDEDIDSREQELRVEVAELTKNLELAKSELEDLKTQIEHYKSIAQSSEEELENMNEVHDAYKESMEQQVSEREVRPLKTSGGLCWFLHTNLTCRPKSANSDRDSKTLAPS